MGRSLNQKGAIPKTGVRQVSEKTDPDYVDKVFAKMLSTYISLAHENREVFLSGLEPKDRERVLEEYKKYL